MIKKLQGGPAHGEAGFTLIEVMIAMSILAVGLMSIAVAQLTAIKMSSRSKHLQDAMLLAREQMDTMEAMPTPTNGAPSFFTIGQTIDEPDEIQLGENPMDQTRYTRRTVITPNVPSANLARVTVTVTWTGSNVMNANRVQLTSVRRIY